MRYGFNVDAAQNAEELLKHQPFMDWVRERSVQPKTDREIDLFPFKKNVYNWILEQEPERIHKLTMIGFLIIYLDLNDDSHAEEILRTWKKEEIDRERKTPVTDKTLLDQWNKSR